MIDEVRLEAVELAARVTLAPQFVNEINLGQIDGVWGDTIVTALMRMPAQRFDTVTIRRPEDWWQAVKHRWFPQWLQRRSPVRWRLTTFDPSIYYPLIKLPDQRNYLHIQRYDRTEELGGAG